MYVNKHFKIINIMPILFHLFSQLKNFLHPLLFPLHTLPWQVECAYQPRGTGKMHKMEVMDSAHPNPHCKVSDWSRLKLRKHRIFKCEIKCHLTVHIWITIVKILYYYKWTLLPFVNNQKDYSTLWSYKPGQGRMLHGTSKMNKGIKILLCFNHIPWVTSPLIYQWVNMDWVLLGARYSSTSVWYLAYRLPP